MADTKTTPYLLLRDQVSGPARKIDRSLAGVSKTATGSHGVLGKLGGALGGLVNPTTLAITGVAALLTGFLVASGKAAVEEGPTSPS